MWKLEKIVSTTLVMGALLVALSGCNRQEGPAERAGKELDMAVEKAGSEVEKAAEKVGEQVEKAGEQIQDAANGDKK